MNKTDSAKDAILSVLAEGNNSLEGLVSATELDRNLIWSCCEELKNIGHVKMIMTTSKIGSSFFVEATPKGIFFSEDGGFRKADKQRKIENLKKGLGTWLNLALTGIAAGASVWGALQADKSDKLERKLETVQAKYDALLKLKVTTPDSHSTLAKPKHKAEH